MNVVKLAECASFVTKDLSLIREIMAPANSTVTRQSLAEATLPPGCVNIAHCHPSTEEIYFILTGSGLMAIENETLAVHAGDAIGILPGERHQIKNTSDVPLVFLCCCVPAYSHEDTFECDALLPS